MITFRVAVCGAVCLTLLTLTCFVGELAQDPVGRVQGAGSLEDCHDCTGHHYIFYECYHTFSNPDCQDDACIENHAWTFSCEPTPPEEEDDCDYEVNNSLVWRYQIARNTSGLTCVDNGWEDIENMCGSDCAPLLPMSLGDGDCAEGKCFLGGCPGTFWYDTTGMYTGRYECDPS